MPATAFIIILLIVIIHCAPSVVARSHLTNTTPPTNIAQERIERCKLILDTISREHVEIFKERRDNFLYTTTKKETQSPVRRPHVISVSIRDIHIISSLNYAP